MIYTFNPVIYPRKVWMTHDATSDELNEMFPTGDVNGNRFKDEDSYYGITYRTADKEDVGGILMRFANNREAMTPWNIAHEAIHAAGYICDFVGIEADWKNDEAFTYLVTWIIKCCMTTLQEEQINND